MNDILTGKVTFPKLLFDREVLTCEPANRKSALVDLNAWANDRDRTIKVGGADVKLKRGQLAYSQQTLAKLWRWDKDKVHRVLTEFQNEGLITFDSSNRTTIITILDYTIYNCDTAAQPEAETDAEPETKPEAETEGNPAAEPEQKLEVGRGKYEGGGEAGEVPDDGEVLGFAAGFAGEPATGTPGPIAAEFAAAWLARMLGRREFPPRWQRALVAEWRAAQRGGARPGNFAASGQEGKSVLKKNGALVSRISLEQEARKLREQVETHKANGPEAGYDLSGYSDEALATLRADLKAKKARLAELDKQLAEGAE